MAQFILNPDLNEVSHLMTRTWEKPEWEYTPELLESYLRRKGQSKSISLGFTHNNELIGYLAGLPYQVHFQGETHNMIFYTFWTAVSNTKIIGLGLRLHNRIMQLSREGGYKGFLTISKSGSMAERAYKAALRRLKCPLTLLCPFTQMIGLPGSIRRRLKKHSTVEVLPYNRKFKAACLELLNNRRQRLDLAKIVEDAECDFLLEQRRGTKTWLYMKNNTPVGLFNVIPKHLLRENETKQLHGCLENMVLPEQQEDALAFLNTVFRDPFWDSIDGVYIPATGNIPPELFKKPGFFPLRGEFNLYTSFFDDPREIKPINSFELDTI